jgi:hypothetical protein
MVLCQMKAPCGKTIKQRRERKEIHELEKSQRSHQASLFVERFQACAWEDVLNEKQSRNGRNYKSQKE